MESVIIPAEAEAAAKAVSRPMPSFSMENLRERSSEKVVLLFFGETDGGKTTQAFSLIAPYAYDPKLPQVETRILCISVDNKSKRIKVGGYKNDKRIWVIDAAQHYVDSQPEDQTFSATVVVEFIEWAIKTVVPKFHPHFIMFDGFDKEKEVAEMKMRYQHGLKPSQGFSERAWWKDRRTVIRALHRLAVDLALVGVIYSCYYDRPAAEEGSERTHDKTPGWFDVVYSESDVAIECRSTYSVLTKSKNYECYVLKSKADLADLAKVGTVATVTGTSFPWGKRVREMVERTDRVLGPVEITYSEESAIPAEVRAPLPSMTDIPANGRSVAATPSVIAPATAVAPPTPSVQPLQPSLAPSGPARAPPPPDEM